MRAKRFQPVLTSIKGEQKEMMGGMSVYFSQVTPTQVKCVLFTKKKISIGIGGYLHADEFVLKTAKRAAFENAKAAQEETDA